MEDANHEVTLNLNEFPGEGLYLLFPDGGRMDFVRRKIDTLAEEYWADPGKIPEEIKRQADFMPCHHCPHHDEVVLCLGLRPLLPYVESVDRYASCDKVTAVFRGNGSNVLHVCHTNMQNALKYLSILSMMHYCEMGDRYRQYFAGVIPLMSAKEMSARIYANIYLHNNGDSGKITSEIASLRAEVLGSSVCLVKRLNMICKKDALINAFINTSAIVESLDFRRFDKSPEDGGPGEEAGAAGEAREAAQAQGTTDK